MQLDILTPDRKIYSGEVNLVKVPGSIGSFEIMKNHAAIISTLVKGEVKIETLSGEKIHYTTNGGVVEVKDNCIIILVESVEQ
jgi:F-type H+-transporting ATPase subunit epsilon